MLSVRSRPLLVLPAGLAAQTLRVSTYGSDVNSGVTWGRSLRTVQAALARAASDPSITRIEVGAGTYKPGGSRGNSFGLVSGVTLVGGYPPEGGTSTDPASHLTILSGDIGVVGDQADNCYSVVVALGVTDARLEGFRIQHGNSDGATTGPWAHGGGLYAQNSRLVVSQCDFRHNLARMGGAVSLWSSGVSFTKCRFLRNFAGAGGGAIANLVSQNPGDVLVDRCEFLGNFGQSYGGAIWNHSRLTACNSVFSGNESLQLGGAVCTTADDQPTTLVNCTLANNRANTSGGAYHQAGAGTAVLVNSIFWRNTAGGTPDQITPSGVGWVHHCCVQGLATAGLFGYANWDADPGLVDPVGRDGVAGTIDDDLHILRSSPCINAGDVASVPIYAMLDMDDQSRIMRPSVLLPAVVDVGADEIGPLTMLFPGDLADLDLHVDVNGNDNGIGDTDAVAVPAGSRLSARITSPQGSLVGMPCVYAIDAFAGSSPPSLPQLAGAHFGATAILLFFPSLPAEGQPFALGPTPAGLSGSMMMQGLVLTPQAGNGLFVGSRGRELRFR